MDPSSHASSALRPRLELKSSPPSTSKMCTKSWIPSLRMVVMILLLLIFNGSGGAHGLRINSNGGYEDIVVAIGSEVPPIICQQFLQNLQALLISTSTKLHTATRGKSYFHRITIVLPASFDARACGKIIPVTYASLSSISQAEINIGAEHPVFAHEPFTQQSEGCGHQGDFIQIGYKYVMLRNETIGLGHPPDLTLLQQWTKYRYGVFDEKGFEKDPIYPMAYHDGESRNDAEKAKVTSCSDKPLKGVWLHCNSTTMSDCTFAPVKSENLNVTSSVMSIEGYNLKHYCNGRSHNAIAPTKQNFLCAKKSIEEIVNQSQDFQSSSNNERTTTVQPPTTTFIFKQLTAPRFLLLFEETNSMNLRDVWKYLKLAVRKFIKYDLQTGTQVGLMTVNNDVRILANMTTLDEYNLRGALAEKLPNYPNIESQQSQGGSFSLRKGISHAINMLKRSNTRLSASGSVIILISQGSTMQHDLESSLQLLKQEEISITTIEYPSVGDGKISFLSKSTNSPHYAIRESGVGTMSHMSTYIQLVNALLDIQRFYTKGIATKWPTLIHQEEFKGDAPSFVSSSFSFDNTQGAGSFYIYVPNPIDPKVNTVELTSPSGVKYTDQLSYLHDINVIKIDALIDQSGIWTYRIQRLGDSHQSHFVQVLASGGALDDLTVRVYSNRDSTKIVNLAATSLILYADVKRGNSPVIGADVVAFLNGNWSVNLFDNGNGDPDLTSNDGVYSRYIIPIAAFHTSYLDITVKVTTSPYRARYIVPDPNSKTDLLPECCGSSILIKSPNSLRTMGYNERVVYSYVIKVLNSRAPGTYAPSRIGDLRVLKTQESRVTLEFTSPGDDLDQGLPFKYVVHYSEKRKMAQIGTKEELNTFQGGSQANLTVDLPGFKLWFISVTTVDRLGNKGGISNVVEVRTREVMADHMINGHVARAAGNSELQMNGRAAGDDEKGLPALHLGLIIAGGVVLVLVLIGLVLCIYCRRRATKTMGSTDTKISTISDTKAPIHWSASELLQEHEKRQSIYQSSQYYSRHPQEGGSPSSTRSFRSIENRRASLDSMSGRRATDYESCSSDKTLKSVKGQTDFESCVESGDEFRTSYPAYPPPYNNSGRGSGSSTSGVQYPPQFHPHQHSTHLQYNPNIQGSLTSVNSKRRNITMV